MFGLCMYCSVSLYFAAKLFSFDKNISKKLIRFCLSKALNKKNLEELWH